VPPTLVSAEPAWARPFDIDERSARLSTSSDTESKGLLLTPGRWVLDPARSRIGFQVFSVPPAKGSFSQAEGELVVEPGSGASASGVIHVDSISTGLGLRDKHLRSSHFFHSERYGQMKFASSRIEQVGATVRMEIRLTIREMTRPVELTGHLHSVEGDPAAVRLHLSGQINRREFGVAWMALDRMMIGARVKLELDLVARRVES
jgi:polyisoprenoid-binding protein YceI